MYNKSYDGVSSSAKDNKLFLKNLIRKTVWFFRVINEKYSQKSVERTPIKFDMHIFDFM